MYHTYLKSLIVDAYGVKYQNILGAPEAARFRQHYDLSAKVAGNALLTKEQMRPMLRSLLEERLHLAVHNEQQNRARRYAAGRRERRIKASKASVGKPYGGGDSGIRV